MFAMKSRPPTTWLPRIRLPRSRYERHDFAMIAPQYTNSTIGVNVRFWHYPEAFEGGNEFRSLRCCGFAHGEFVSP